MAFAVPAWKTYAVSIDQVSQCRYEQITVISCTGTTADVAYDFGGNAGTFFTSANGDVTHGAKSIALAAFFVTLKTLAQSTRVKSPIIGVSYVWYKTAPSADTDVNISSFTSCVPNIRFKANKAPTAVIWILRSVLLNGVNPVASTTYGTI